MEKNQIIIYYLSINNIKWFQQKQNRHFFYFGFYQFAPYYWGIGLVEVMWKVMAAILNHRVMDSITFHNFLHGLRAGRVTGTATLEANMLQQIAALKEEVLYIIFLDLHKAYDSLDRSR